jgi:NADH dehydrogenase [ubiquinone] 1 alpha subcomplex assembly factor 5
MRDLKGMAENNASWTRKYHLHKDTLLAANAIYQQLYGSISKEDGSPHTLPATFQMYFWIAWKPDPMQPKALQPQKSDISLKDLYKLDEVVETKFQSEKDTMNPISKE